MTPTTLNTTDTPSIPWTGFRSAYQRLCKSMPGGWATMAASLGLTLRALENRVYERHGQEVSLDLAMQMQTNSGTTVFAEAVAAASGGVFVPLPPLEELDQRHVEAIFVDLVDQLGGLTRSWKAVTSDGVVSKVERQHLDEIRRGICTRVTQINELTFRAFPIKPTPPGAPN